MSAPLVLVLVGTDHHRFDRLVDWVDAWAQGRRANEAEVFVQHGTSRAPRHAGGRPYVDHDELQALMARARLIVCAGGPATIAEARRHGRLPIVVPRTPERQEHVDDHQLRFSAAMDGRGYVRRCDAEQQLHDLLDAGLADPELLAVPPAAAGAEGPARTVARLADALVRPRRGEPGDDPVRVLYVGGLGRSGSTVLSSLLGAVDGVASVGEVVHLWERGIVADEPCGCGTPFRSCPFWSAVGERAFGGWDRVDLDELRSLRRAVDRTRHVPLTTAAHPPARVAALAREYAAAYAAVYRAVRDVSGARVVVDSSKHVSLAAVLGWADGVALRTVHLVRDSRGVAHSTSKLVERPERPGELMHRADPARTAVEWSVQNLLFDLVGRRHPLVRLTYDDLIADPDAELAALQRFAGLDDAPGTRSFLDGAEAVVPRSHMVSGNPVRFNDGPLRLRPDLGWTTGLDRRHRQVVTALTFPLLKRYRIGSVR